MKTRKNQNQDLSINEELSPSPPVQDTSFTDNSPEGIEMSQYQEKISNSSEVLEMQDYQDKITPKRKKKNTTGIPDNIKHGIESLSGISLDDVKVYYNSPKPAEIDAHAYAEGTNVYIAPGQEEYLPHELWHIVQQKQGIVRGTTKVNGKKVNDQEKLEKEATDQGDKAKKGGTKTTSLEEPVSSAPPQDIIQAVFIFSINPADYTVKDSKYFRIQGNKFMTGNKQEKHITADTIKDNLWTQFDGLTLDAFGEKVIDIANTYQNLPGMEIANIHKLSPEDENDDGLNKAMIDNYGLFSDSWNNLSYHSSHLSAAVSTFKSAATKKDKDAAAFLVQNYALALIRNIEEFSDLMPFVNMISTIQKGGNEREAKAFLKTGKKTKNVKNTNDALWAFFDFASIEELYGKDIIQNVEDSLPWIDINKLADEIARREGLAPEELAPANIFEAIAGIMLGNHIRLIKLAYPTQTNGSPFGTPKNIALALKANGITDKMLDYKDVISYAIEGFYKDI